MAGRLLPVLQQYNKVTLDRLIQEGDGTGSSFTITNSYGTFPSGLQSGAGVSIGGMTVPHGKALYIDSIVVSSNKSAWFFCQTGGNYDGSFLPGGGTWTGNRVHPSGLGHTLIATYIWSVSKTWLYNALK